MYGWDSNEIVNDLGHLMEKICKNADDTSVKSDIIVSFKLLDLIDHDNKNRVNKYRKKFSELSNGKYDHFTDNFYQIKSTKKITTLLDKYISASQEMINWELDCQNEFIVSKGQTIVDEFLKDLDLDFYNIYTKNYDTKKITSIENSGPTIFAAQMTLKKSYINFNNSNKLSDLVAYVHQLSHVIDYEYSEYNDADATYWCYLEVISQLNELFFLDYLLKNKHINEKVFGSYQINYISSLTKKAEQIKNSLINNSVYSSEILYFESSLIAYNIYNVINEKQLNKADVLKYIIRNRTSDFKNTLNTFGVTSENDGYIKYIDNLKKMIY